MNRTPQPGRIDDITLSDPCWHVESSAAAMQARDDAMRAFSASLPSSLSERGRFNGAAFTAAIAVLLALLGVVLALVVGIYRGGSLALSLLPDAAAFIVSHPLLTGVALGSAVLVGLYFAASAICDRHAARAEFADLIGDR